MNVFELSIILTPIAGAASGVRSGMAHGSTTAIVTGIVGLLVGVATFAICAFSPMLLFRVVVGREVNIEPKPLEWSLGTLVVLGAVAAPFVAWWIVSSGLALFWGAA